MKKLSPLFALLLLMVALTGCSPKEEPNPEDVVVPEIEGAEVDTGLVTEEDTTNTGEATFEAAKKELELINQ